MRVWSLFCLLGALVLPLTAAPVATLAGLEGDVSVVRDGRTVPSERIGENFPLEAFDTITTAATGRAELRWAALTGLSGTVRLDPSTSLYLDVTTLQREQTAGLELQAGAVTVRHLAGEGASRLEVRTDALAASAAQAVFRVALTWWGDALVTVTSGKVLCQGDRRSVFAEAGTSVEGLSAERTVTSTPVTAVLGVEYEKAWQARRSQTLRDQAAQTLRGAAARYLLQAGTVQRAWDRVQREGTDNARSFQAAVARLRSAAAPWERSLVRLKGAAAFVTEGLVPATLELSRGTTVQDFLRLQSADEALWTPRLAQARAWYRTVADRNGGVFPGAGDAAVVTAGSDFFN